MAFPRTHRLKDRARIGRVLRFGRRANMSGIHISLLRSSNTSSRAVVLVPKTADKRATARNAARRRAIEALRPLLPHLSPPADVAVGMGKGSLGLSVAELQERFEVLLKKVS